MSTFCIQKGVTFKPVHEQFHTQRKEVYAASLALQTPSRDKGSRAPLASIWGLLKGRMDGACGGLYLD